MNLLEVGGLLRRERERRRLSVRDVMEATKISRRNLNALEEGEVKLLPHPVYLKGYVRNYARLVGLDPEALVAVVDQQSDGDSGYLPQAPSVVAAEAQPVAAPLDPVTLVADPAAAEPVPGAPEPVQPPKPAPVAVEPAPEPESHFTSQIRFPAEDYSGAPRKRVWPWVLLGVCLLVAAVGYVQILRIAAESEQAAAPAPEAPVLADNASNATAEANATEPAANATLPLAASPAAPEQAPAPAPSPAPAPAPALAPAVSAPPASAPPTPPAAKAAAPSVPAAPVEVSRKTTPPAAEARTPGMQELVVTAKPGETCWVEVSEGTVKKSFTLREGDSRRFEFTSKARVRLGNAGGVSFQLNGAYYPYDGERGQTATVEIGAR